MKILIASDAYYPPNVSGVAYFSYRLATYMAKRGHKVFVVAPSLKMKNTVGVFEGVTVYGVTSFGVPVHKGFRISPISLTHSYIENIIKDTDPDVVHVQSHFKIGKVAVEVSKKYGIPIVGTNHFMPENLVHYFHLPKFAEKKLIQHGWREFVKVYKEVNLVTTPTKRAAKLLINIGLPKEIKVISCGIDLSRFSPRNSGAYLKKRYKIPVGKKIILYVGRLAKEKNIDIAIRALPEILVKCNAHLVIAGEGSLEKNLKKLTQEIGVSKNVTFTGFVSDADLPNLYSMANVFIAPGIAELQCISALEAIATGLPLVAADAVALPELVRKGKNGFLFSPGDNLSLSKAIIKILANNKLARKMRKESLNIAHKHDILHVMYEFEDVYKRVVLTRPLKRENLGNESLAIFPEFILRISLVIILLGFLFRNTLISPSTAQAKGLALKNKIMNSKIVMKIENLDTKIKTAYPTLKPGI